MSQAQPLPPQTWPRSAQIRARTVTQALQGATGLFDTPLTSWAVINAALYKGDLYYLIERHAHQYPGEVHSLFDGVAFHSMGRVGPWLLRLRPESELFHKWFDGGWGESWGIFLATRSNDMQKVRLHLKKILNAYVPDPDNNTDINALYRYFDPVVLRSTLPFFSQGFMEGLFGGVVELFLVEGVRTVQVDGKEVINEIYRYSLTKETVLEKLSGVPRLREGTITLALPEPAPSGAPTAAPAQPSR